MKKILLIILLIPIIGLAQVGDIIKEDTNQRNLKDDETDFTRKEIDMIMEQNIPPAPNAAEFSKIQDLAIDEFTGAFSTSIPLLTLKSRGIEIPISLNYHTTGVKVDQEASNVGLGWSLSAGGVINRTVKGLCDEMYYTSNNGIITNYFVGYQRYGETGSSDEHSRDHLPDEFSINVPGLISGNFYFTTEREILEGSYNGFQIEESRISGGELDEMINGFTIVDKSGNNYLFDEVEKIETRSSGDKPTMINGNFREYTSSFYLKEIVNSNNQESFSFIYEIYSVDGGNLVEQHDPKVYNYFGNYTSNGYWCDFCSDHLYTGWEYSNIPYSWSYRKIIAGKRLNKIIFQDGYVVFSYDEEREDIENDQALKSIELYTNDNVLIKKFTLNYSYFISTGGTSSFLNKRLKLVSVVESGKEESDDLPPYQFFYNELELAPKRMYRSDFWGYNNGDNIDNKYFPKLYYYSYLDGKYTFPFELKNNSNSYEIFSNDYCADKNPNLNALAASLEIIRYPTGAYQKIVYELNEFELFGEKYQGNGIRVKEFKVYSENSLLKKIKYNYNKEGTDESSGKISLIPQFGYECNGMTNGGVVFTSNNNNIAKYSKESLLTYSCVTKEIYNSDETQFNGSIVSKYYTDADYDNFDVDFSVPEDHPYCPNISLDPSIITINDYPFIQNFSNELLRGSLKERIIYDIEGNMVQRIEETPDLVKFDSVQIHDRRTYFYHFTEAGDFDYPVTGSYYLRSAVSKPKTSVSEDYFGSNHITKSIERQYDNQANLKKISSFSPNGTNDIQLEFKYPYEYGFSDFAENENDIIAGFYLMDSKNMTNIPLETVKKVGKNETWRIVDAELNTPLKLSTDVLGFSDVQYLQATDPIDDDNYEFSDLDENGDLTANDNYEKSIVFEEYDNTTGQILQLKKENGVSIVILWGYGRKYPIAKIVNSNFNDVMEALEMTSGIYDYDNLQLQINSENLINYFKSLREYSGMKQAQITSYTYKPLIGVETITDINGLTTNYFYDDYGRLEKITNDEGFIQQYMEYHYKDFEDCFSVKQICEQSAYSIFLYDQNQCLMNYHPSEPEFDQCMGEAEIDYNDAMYQCEIDYDNCIPSEKKK